MLELIDGLSEMQKPEQYASWLWIVLTDFYPSFNEVNQNSRLYKFIEKRELESSTHALSIVYVHHLSNDAQANFRNAIGIALHKCIDIPDKRFFNPASDLVYLIGQTKAVEALDSLLEVNSNEFIAKNHGRILYETMANIQGLNLDDKVFDFTHNLVESPFFDDGYLFTAIKVMVDCKPDKYNEIVNECKERIQKLYGIIQGNKDEESAYWDQVDILFAKQLAVNEMIHSFSKI